MRFVLLAMFSLLSCVEETDGGRDAAVICGDRICLGGEMCCSAGCDERGVPIEVCDDDCSFTPTGPVYECM